MSKTKSAATVYVAKIWHSDFHFSRIFTSRGDAEKAIAEALKRQRKASNT